MSREKELVAVLTAMVEIVNRKVSGMTPEEREATFNAVKLLTEIAQDCDECVDY